MLESNPQPSVRSRAPLALRSCRTTTPDRTGEKKLQARVKPECGHLYPGVDPKVWYQVVQEGEYRDDLEGLWIQVNDWVTYVLARHFDVQTGPELH
jgi:hypothetical protein